MGYALNETAWGVRVYAIGNSPNAARLNGVNVTRVVFSVYALAGVFYGFAAWQALGRTPIADPSGYQIANLDSITAVVIGGTSLFGGRGGVAGTFVGTLIVVALKNGLTQAGIDSAVSADRYWRARHAGCRRRSILRAGATRMTPASHRSRVSRCSQAA